MSHSSDLESVSDSSSKLGTSPHHQIHSGGEEHPRQPPLQQQETSKLQPSFQTRPPTPHHTRRNSTGSSPIDLYSRQPRVFTTDANGTIYQKLPLHQQQTVSKPIITIPLKPTTQQPVQINSESNHTISTGTLSGFHLSSKTSDQVPMTTFQ